LLDRGVVELDLCLGLIVKALGVVGGVLGNGLPRREPGVPIEAELA